MFSRIDDVASHFIVDVSSCDLERASPRVASRSVRQHTHPSRVAENALPQGAPPEGLARCLCRPTKEQIPARSRHVHRRLVHPASAARLRLAKAWLQGPGEAILSFSGRHRSLAPASFGVDTWAPDPRIWPSRGAVADCVAPSSRRWSEQSCPTTQAAVRRRPLLARSSRSPIGIARRRTNRQGAFEQRDRLARDTPMDQYTREKVT